MQQKNNAQQKINILISNDDGADAPGINTLADFVSNEHNVTVVAPDKNRSGSSSALTLDRPLRCRQLDNGYYALSGTPCDCVHIGSYRFMDTPPDMVLSGINRGANMGDDVLYSGTVAAAMEGRHLGIPAVAVSLASYECNHYETAAQVILKILFHLRDLSSASNIILNVNVPDLPLDEIKGYRLTRLGSRHRADNILPDTDPRGNDIFWIGPPSAPQDVGEGTDFDAVKQGFVSITPLVVDFTAYESFQNMGDWVNKLGL
ncbi:MAG: 5'/3'-nucleotidase SurE [Gammaproteobacteria bacterium]|nr:5'/3'-nucleotidase SurE [Gammaproteobacteria bacterium]MDH5629813.1 5'/3'-nucleotidase SurE [Gammaproteobacteria bacterium]